MTPRRILLAAWTTFVLFGYPGFMRSDAADELVDSRTGAFTDWHSPVLTEIWRVLGRLVAGPAPLFLLLGSGILLGAYGLLRLRLTPRAAALGAAGVLLAPPLIATTSVVGSDAALSAALLGGFALALGEGPRRRAAGWIVLVFGASLGAGMIVAVAPLVAFVIRRHSAGWRSIGYGLVACACIATARPLLERAFVDDRTSRREVELAQLDVVGILRYGGKIDSTAPLVAAADLPDRARAAYGHANRFDRGARPVFDPITTPDQRAQLIALRESWSRRMPGPYLHHRIHELSLVLGFYRGKTWRAFKPDFVPNRKDRLVLGHAAHHSLLQRVLEWPVKVLSHTFLFFPYVYLLVAMGLLVAAIVRKHALAATLLISGIAYELALGLVTTHVEYSASHWMMVATVLGAIAIITRELESRDERVLEQTSVAVADDDQL